MSNSTNAATAGLEIPAMHFSFHEFSTFTGTPMGVRIPLYGCKCMNMSVGRPQFKAAMNAKLIFPILGVFACNVGLDVCHSHTSVTPSPMTGFVGMYGILVANCTGTPETTIITNLIANGSVDMCVSIHFLMTSHTDFPVAIFVGKHFTGCFVSIFQNISAGFTGF